MSRDGDVPLAFRGTERTTARCNERMPPQYVRLREASTHWDLTGRDVRGGQPAPSGQAAQLRVAGAQFALLLGQIEESTSRSEHLIRRLLEPRVQDLRVSDGEALEDLCG